MVRHHLTEPTTSSTCPRPMPNGRSPWSRIAWPHLLGALDQSKLAIQKDVVKNEYRQNYANRPYGMVWPLIAEALYPPQHPYSWMTIGVMEDLDRATMEDVSAFFRRFYVPSNASLAIVGDLDEDEALALAERYFEPIPGGSARTAALGPRRRPRETRPKSCCTIASSSIGSISSGRLSRIFTVTTRLFCSWETCWLAADRAACIASW